MALDSLEMASRGLLRDAGFDSLTMAARGLLIDAVGGPTLNLHGQTRSPAPQETYKTSKPQGIHLSK